MRTESLTPSSPEPSRFVLRVTRGRNAGRELVLTQGLYRVGTHPTCDLVLEDRAVSATHLIVEVMPDELKVTDNQSTNGSFVQGMRFTALNAKAGAALRIGRTELWILSARTASLPLSQRERMGELVGQSGPMRELFSILERLSQTRADVLLVGETGTGKELCAEALHHASPRAAGPFVVCDLASAAPSLFESELFGHAKGAFTGADTAREGTFERAHGGTLFLDEIGELPAEIQPRLLRALERRQVKRVGSNDYVTVDVRVVAATHRNLEAEIQAGRFRADLYHRLAVVQVTVPPLRERPEDIPVLVDHILERLGRAPAELSQQTRDMLLRYHWPGNVRELRNAVERAVSLGAPGQPGSGVASTAREGADLPFKEAKEQLVSTFERDYLATLLRKCEGNLSRTAREAEIDRVYLRKLLQKHQLEARNFKQRGGD